MVIVMAILQLIAAAVMIKMIRPTLLERRKKLRVLCYRPWWKIGQTQDLEIDFWVINLVIGQRSGR